MKNILISMICSLIILGIAGCSQNNTKVTLKITQGSSSGWTGKYESKAEEIEVKTGDKLTYELMIDTFTFDIVRITDDKIEIKVDKKGLSAYSSNGAINLNGEFTEFTIEKGKPLLLSTQTMDASGSITFEY